MAQLRLALAAVAATLVVACSDTGPNPGTTTNTGGTTTNTGGTTTNTDGGDQLSCPRPEYSTDCSQVPRFECGVSSSCEGSVLVVTWHDHVLCGAHDEVESIYDYTCTFPCATECVEPGSVSSGPAAVAEACVGGGGGGNGSTSGDVAGGQRAAGGASGGDSASAGTSGSGGVEPGGSGGAAGAPGGVDPGGSAGAGGACIAPEYSTDCSLVPDFQCGFDPTCEGNTLRVSWHEHLSCGGDAEQIQEYTCTYGCADACRIPEWNGDGASVVAEACAAGGAGGAGGE